MNQQGIDRFSDGVQALLLSQPFFGTLLMKMKHVPEACGSLYVDGVTIGYDPDFMALQSIEQAQAAIRARVRQLLPHCSGDKGEAAPLIASSPQGGAYQ